MENEDENLDETTRAGHHTYYSAQILIFQYQHITVAGMPVCFFPRYETKYRSFLDWWFQVGGGRIMTRRGGALFLPLARCLVPALNS